MKKWWENKTKASEHAIGCGDPETEEPCFAGKQLPISPSWIMDHARSAGDIGEDTPTDKIDMKISDENLGLKSRLIITAPMSFFPRTIADPHNDRGSTQRRGGAAITISNDGKRPKKIDTAPGICRFFWKNQPLQPGNEETLLWPLRTPLRRVWFWVGEMQQLICGGGGDWRSREAAAIICSTKKSKSVTLDHSKERKRKFFERNITHCPVFFSTYKKQP